MSIALHDPGEEVRTAALEALEEHHRAVPAVFLRELHRSETVSDVRDAVESLIVEKGDLTLSDVFLRLVLRQEDWSYTAEKAIERLVECRDVDHIARAFAHCIKRDHLEAFASKAYELTALGLTEQAERVVDWCLQHRKEESRAILAVGKLPAIPLARIAEYEEHSNPILRADAIRASEYRKRSGLAVERLRMIYRELQQAVKRTDDDAMWGSLEAIDGIIEFGQREEAIGLLREYYDTVDRLIPGGSFPLRAAWDRLKVLGVVLDHPMYKKDNDVEAYPWPDPSGPFYGIGGGTVHGV